MIPLSRIEYAPIGVIHSPFQDLADMPIQPTSQASRPGTVEIYPEFVLGLQDLAGFSHLYLIYHLHKAKRVDLKVTPFLDDRPHGVFATRAPNRPNPIGLSLVKLKRIEGAILHVSNLDVLDGTPLLDLKPYLPPFEEAEDVRLGWLEGGEHGMREQKSDDRFR